MECDVRRISQQDMKIYIRFNFTEPMNTIWIHGIFYYKYISYQKFPIDLWEDYCAWVRGEKPTYFLKWTAENVRNYSNMNHPCPYSGTAWIDVKRMPLNRLIVLDQLMPSGRYRVDLNLTRGYKDQALIMTRFYFGISDTRVEQF
ncbi:uncharacterized protein LOC129568098 [Sitodiplosis mosellana]|uniref:uncharacterized protein LOC129568098 n=1 Tax=Sitodiplosis mosellana TaxID=263140 RepID=UPI002444B5C9|nr:uncharacterized protein LOC129568098 [Sitodiplosis mosellana]